MSENPNAKLIVQVLQAENLKLMQSNDFVSAKNVVEAIVWFNNIIEPNTEEEKPSPEETRAKQAMQLVFPLPKDNDTPDAPKQEQETKQVAKEEKVAIKFRKTTQVETQKRIDWLLKTIKEYNGITEPQLLGLYITSQDINHTAAELSKTNPKDKQVRGWALACRYLYRLIEKEHKVYINEKGYLFAV
jgi:hypothetical protein